jgi:hypothetical protein
MKIPEHLIDDITLNSVDVNPNAKVVSEENNTQEIISILNQINSNLIEFNNNFVRYAKRIDNQLYL